MKKLLKLSLALCGVFMLASASGANAQKYGYIDFEAVLMKMPGLEEVQANLQKFAADLDGQMNIMQEEFNKKYEEYQKGFATYSDAVKKDKEAELSTLEQRIQSFRVDARDDITAEQERLLSPLMEKLEASIEKVSKANNIAAVFNSAAFVYFDPQSLTDMAPLVSKELGIK